MLITLASGWQLARRLEFLAVPYPQHWWIVASFIAVAVMAITAYAVVEHGRCPQTSVVGITRLDRPSDAGEALAGDLDVGSRLGARVEEPRRVLICRAVIRLVFYYVSPLVFRGSRRREQRRQMEWPSSHPRRSR